MFAEPMHHYQTHEIRTAARQRLLSFRWQMPEVFGGDLQHGASRVQRQMEQQNYASQPQLLPAFPWHLSLGS